MATLAAFKAAIQSEDFNLALTQWREGLTDDGKPQSRTSFWRDVRPYIVSNDLRGYGSPR